MISTADTSLKKYQNIKIRKEEKDYYRDKINVFYDTYEQANLWGKDLYEHLDDIYSKKSRFVIMFISKEYAEKLWTTHERKSAQARAFKEKEEYILPVKFDKTEIPGIRDTIGYLDANKFNPDELVDIFMKKFFKDMVWLKEDGLTFDSKFPTRRFYNHLASKAIGERFDNIAGALQYFTEKLVTEWIKNAIKETGIFEDKSSFAL